MNCPNCDTINIAYSSRSLYKGARVRYYKCKNCNLKYSTRFQFSETIVKVRDNKSG